MGTEETPGLGTRAPLRFGRRCGAVRFGSVRNRIIVRRSVEQPNFYQRGYLLQQLFITIDYAQYIFP